MNLIDKNEINVFEEEGVVYVSINGQDWSAEAYEAEDEIPPMSPAQISEIARRIDFHRDRMRNRSY